MISYHVLVFARDENGVNQTTFYCRVTLSRHETRVRGMPRPAKPWFWASRSRWATTIDGVRHTAPATVCRQDVHGAWAWHRALLDRLASREPSTLRVCDLAEQWLAWDEDRVTSGDRSLAAHRSARSKLAKICGTLVKGRKFGLTPLADVRPGHLETLQQAWSIGGECSAGYRIDLATMVKTLFRWASRPATGHDPWLDTSPFTGVTLPPSPPSPERFASRDEAASWLRWLWRRGLRDFALLQRCLIHTGARPSELAEATWGEIHWDAQPTPSGHSLSILTRRAWKCAKRTGRVRRVFLPAKLCRSLRRRMASPDGLMWTTPRGKPWRGANLSCTVARLRTAAIGDGCPIQADGPDRLHNYRWRHTAASTLVMAGVDLATVAELLGTSVKMLTSTYAHLLIGHLGKAAERLARGR